MSNKMAINTYLQIIAMTVNGLCSNQNTQCDRMDEKARPIQVLPNRNSFQI